MHELPKSLVELQLEEKVSKLERENQELRWKANIQPSSSIVGMSASEAVKIPRASFKRELHLVAGAGYRRELDGVQYFGYICRPERYEIGVWCNTSMVWNRTGAIYHLDNLNRNIQGELLKALEK